MPGHAARASKANAGRILRIYDNAGESFQQGMEKEESPVTRHMAMAEGLMFVFDPTQENSFREACRQQSGDPQWRDSRTSHQQGLFSEAMRRIQRFAGRPETERVRKPLIVVLAKYDAWGCLANAERLPDPWRRTATGAGGEGRLTFDFEAVKRVSRACRDLLDKHASSMLSLIETTCAPETLLFVPVSSTGCPPAGKNEGGYYHLAKDIKPMWAEVPLLALLHMCAPDLMTGSGG
jgi:hypothetical protein